MGFLSRINYVYWIEILVILGVIILTAFIFYSLGLIKKKG
jgi:hypothetical protein